MNVACESFGACICNTIWHKYITHFILEIKICSAMKSKFDSQWKSIIGTQWKFRWIPQSKSRFAPRWTGSRFVEMDKENAGDGLRQRDENIHVVHREHPLLTAKLALKPGIVQFLDQPDSVALLHGQLFRVLGVKVVKSFAAWELVDW